MTAPMFYEFSSEDREKNLQHWKVLRFKTGDKFYLVKNADQVNEKIAKEEANNEANDQIRVTLNEFTDSDFDFQQLEDVTDEFLKNQSQYRFNHKLVIVQALLSDKKDLIAVENYGQLGVSMVIPWMSDFSNVKVDAKSKEKILKRYQNELIEGSRIARSPFIPKLHPIITSSDLAKHLPKYQDWNLLVLDPGGEIFNQVFPHVTPDPKNISFKNTLVFVGPEGGFSEREYQIFEEYNVKKVSLGSRIYRANLAGVLYANLMLNSYNP